MTMSFNVGFRANQIFFVAFGFIVLFMISRAIFIRYNNTNGMRYLISNKRILFIKNGTLKKQKNIADLEEVTYENSSNDRGYIILGKVEELFDGRGISFGEDKYVLDNLTNYKQVSDLIKKLTQISN